MELVDLLTDMADAIREVKGTQTPIVAAEIPLYIKYIYENKFPEGTVIIDYGTDIRAYFKDVCNALREVLGSTDLYYMKDVPDAIRNLKKDFKLYIEESNFIQPKISFNVSNNDIYIKESNFIQPKISYSLTIL